MKIVLVADHRGFALKESIKNFLREGHYEVDDVGAHALNPQDDYPDFAYAGAVKVAAENGARGIFVCGSAMGMDVVANKIKGIRATVAYSKESTIHARTNDDVNVITLAGDVLNEDAARDIISSFLTTPFSGEERHRRRLEKIAAIENDRLR